MAASAAWGPGPESRCGEAVLGPLVLYLLVGTLFLLAGFVSLCFTSAASSKQGGTKTDKLGS